MIRQTSFHPVLIILFFFLVLLVIAPALASGRNDGMEGTSFHDASPDNSSGNVQLGPRPFFLVEDMEGGELKSKLARCGAGPFRKTYFSIGHRGAPLQFPEHTAESYRAAARMGAGILECDVTFTRDKELVCRHSQCDLHTTTNILETPLAEKCTRPFTPAQFDASGNLIQEASARCCTSDITLDEFKSLKGKMDAFNPGARNVAEYVGGTPAWRTDLYAGPTSGTLLSHRESIELFSKLGAKMTPELKSAEVAMPYDSDGDGVGDYTQEHYAQQMIDEYKAADVKPRDVFPQSFDIRDIRYWIAREPEFGRQAVYLDDANTVADLPNASQLTAYKAEGINIVAPPIFALLDVDGGGNIIPSSYALQARAAGLGLITWTLERSGILADGDNGFYYQTFDSAIRREGDVMKVLDVLNREVGVLGIFSDWPATVSYYANCMKLK
ncbi:glycerophosphoryl diester phosphodiesterase [Nitrosospira multiformis ATCC 25196]|uniref:glycerophosphodiester phosphodiesterase n=2 Tax=Nitrosospira multiformis TaxID=1231 RepID=Q2Y5W1_NITMU|nr:glycerophosphodiester phosphodiesterase family protein [Nitrosospira multiformis]ABB75860.1 Glycerophosphoryl diester phosphodiesterase [Nitrosospira multiformis ATCC 25196]SEF64791.1 glycerophosphoryl diester phosphodiesterase [Nitrosospira multiformis ATCC 25196]